jgi:hypothetical protein
MIRLSLLYALVLILSIYAWKDWYASLCGLILLMAFLEHKDMPKAIFGVGGLNLWNILFFSVLFAWMFTRNRKGLRWDLPRRLNILLLLYLGVVLVGFVRMIVDHHGFAVLNAFLSEESGELMYPSGAVRELLFNTLKWTIPGLLLFDGCRSRTQLTQALWCVLGIYFLLGLQVIKWMPLGSIAESGKIFEQRAVRVLDREIGYQRVDLSMMLAGAAWAIFSLRLLAKKKSLQTFVVLASMCTFFAQLLTGGRGGYVAWSAVGLALCLLRWRKYLLLAPVGVLLVVLAVPSVGDRIFQGMNNSQVDEYELTAGRNVMWPHVLQKISEAPLFGYGRMGMPRSGTSAEVLEKEGESFRHPHNAYLEMLLDSGIVGLALVLPFYAVVLWQSVSLFRDSRSPVFVAVGGITFSLVFALLVSGMSAQSFYPREGNVGMWCAIGLMLRVSVERARALRTVRLEREGESGAASLPAEPQWKRGRQRRAFAEDLTPRLWQEAA